jgi:hypothetical protein
VKFGGRHLSITAAKTGTFGVRLGTEQAFGKGLHSFTLELKLNNSRIHS